MKAAQIREYSDAPKVEIVELPTPEINENEVLVKVVVAAVNPLDLLNITGNVKMIHDYEMPLTIGNELSGTIEKVGSQVTKYKVGDQIITRLPIEKIGAFAEYVAVDARAISFLPENLDLVSGAGVALTGLTAYQALFEELNAEAGQTIFIPGGSGSFGQMAVPIAKAMGLKVIVSGSTEAKERTIKAGADRYIDYKEENYWEVLDKVDHVIDTLGPDELAHELSIIKPGGKLLSLRGVPNKRFAVSKGMPEQLQAIFAQVGAEIDQAAAAQDVEYHFMFVRADGGQLDEVKEIVEKNNISPAIDPTEFKLEQVNEALGMVAQGHHQGKVVIRF